MRKLTGKLSAFVSFRLGQEVKYCIYTLSQTKVLANLLLCGAARSTPRLLSYVKKVGKDTPKTSWFLDFQQKGALPPLDTPSGESSFARFSGAMTAKVISAKTKTLPCPLSTPPMMLEASVVNEGERHGVTVGETSPRGDIKEDTSSLIRFWLLFS